MGESVICTFLAALLIASCSDSVNQAREVNPFSSGLPRYNLRPRAVKVDLCIPDSMDLNLSKLWEITKDGSLAL